MLFYYSVLAHDCGNSIMSTRVHFRIIYYYVEKKNEKKRINITKKCVKRNKNKNIVLLKRLGKLL